MTEETLCLTEDDQRVDVPSTPSTNFFFDGFQIEAGKSKTYWVAAKLSDICTQMLIDRLHRLSLFFTAWSKNEPGEGQGSYQAPWFSPSLGWYNSHLTSGFWIRTLNLLPWLIQFHNWFEIGFEACPMEVWKQFNYMITDTKNKHSESVTEALFSQSWTDKVFSV